MAQYDILLYQNVSPSTVLFKEQFVNIAKGAILSSDASGVPTVLAAGTNDFVLTADSTTTTGLRWAAAGSSAVFRTDATTKSTRGGISAGNTETQGAARYNTYLGYEAGYTATGTNNNVMVGYQAGFYNTGSGNVHMGRQAGYLQGAGDGNVYIGDQCGYTGGSGDNNCCIGQSAGYNLTGSDTVIIGSGAGLATGAASYNVFVGKEAGKTNTTGTYNTYIGYLAGYSSNTVSYNVAIGNSAGCFETVGYKLFIDGLNRSDEATARTNSMIYGVFNATPTSQQLWLNAKVYMNKLDTGTTSYVLYVDNTTGELTKGAISGGSQWTTDTYGITYGTSSGNVGIGSASNSSYKLLVSGTAYFSTHIYLLSGTMYISQAIHNDEYGLYAGNGDEMIACYDNNAGGNGIYYYANGALNIDGDGTYYGNTATVRFFNSTVTTTASIFGAATTLTIGCTGTETSTTNITTGNVASGNSKTINIGTGGQVSSTTSINIGCGATGVQPGTLTFGGFGTIVHNSNRTSLDLFNTNTTTLNFAGAAETLTLGNTVTTATQTISIGSQSTRTQTINIGNGATESGYTKNIYIASNGLSGSTFTLSIGTVASTSTVEIGGYFTVVRSAGTPTYISYTGTTAATQVMTLRHGATSGTTVHLLQAQYGSGSAGGYINMNISTKTLTFVSDSDERLKTNINIAKFNALDIINNIAVKTFNFKSNPNDSLIRGFVAQDVYKLYPEAVNYDNENDIFGLSWGNTMNPLYHKAIQELTDKIKQLETEIQTLKS